MKHLLILFSAMAIISSSVLSGCASGNGNANSNEANEVVKAVVPEEYQSPNQEGQQKVYDFVKACNTYYIATADGNQPRVRPFGTIHIFEGKLYIQTGYKKNVAKQILANPLFELCAFNGSEWIRVSGKLVDDPRVEAKKSMLDDYSSLRGMYDENDDNTAVFFIADGIATISSFTAQDVTIEF